MRTALFVIIALINSFLVTAFADSPKAAKSSTDSAAASTKQPVHLVVNSDKEARQIFTYFPYPIPPTEYRYANFAAIGQYRLTIDSEGAVTQIQILRRFGYPVLDALALKTFIRWRAKPGPPRIVDVGWLIAPGFQRVSH